MGSRRPNRSPNGSLCSPLSMRTCSRVFVVHHRAVALIAARITDLRLMLGHRKAATAADPWLVLCSLRTTSASNPAAAPTFIIDVGRPVADDDVPLVWTPCAAPGRALALRTAVAHGNRFWRASAVAEINCPSSTRTARRHYWRRTGGTDGGISPLEAGCSNHDPGSGRCRGRPLPNGS